MANTQANLRNLVLSATEIKNLTGWEDAMVEDYLNILESFITLAGTIDNNEALGLDSIADLENGLGQAIARAETNHRLIQGLSSQISDFLGFHGMIFAMLNKQKKRIDDNEQSHYAE